MGGEGAADGPGGENEDFDAVDALAADHIGDAPEQERADSGGEERRGFDKALFEFAGVPQRLQHAHHNANDEQVVGVGEEAHAGDEHDLPVHGGGFGFVEFAEIGGGEGTD